MYVVKRDGKKEAVKFDKITARIVKMCYGLDPLVSPEAVAMKVIEGLFDGVSTTELDNLAAEVAAAKTIDHPDYALLASRIAVSNLHKETKKTFSEVMHDLYHYVDSKTNESAALLADDVYQIIMANKEVLDSSIIYDRDFRYDYFGFKTLTRSYLMRLNGKIAERPQQMLMRVAVGIHKDDIQAAIKTYNLMSEGWFTHATPTLFNSGTPKPQMSSCFLLTMKEDSISGIYDTLKSCAQISQSAGGIGLSIHDIRATGSYIKGTNGASNGIVPMLRVFNDTARYVDQGGGKRKGSFAIYIEPWHADVFDFLDLKKNHGKEEQRARDLFYALWIPDLFMKRVKENGDWTLMCPHECPGLSDSHSAAFEKLYTKYEQEGKGRKTIKAQDLWFKILESQIETGTPYMLYKDAANSKSNQQNLGTIKSSNLCTEIIEYTAPDGSRQRPVMIHRALFGSVERFFGVLTEHYAGHFPPWLAPVQVVGVPVANEFADYLDEIAALLRAKGVRVSVDASDDRMQKKILNHTKAKVPFMLIAGGQDRDNGAVSFRFRDGSQENGIPVDQAVARILEAIESKAQV